MYDYCQMCGNPIFTDEGHGTDENGQYSRDFCSNCYQHGQFTMADQHEGASVLPVALPAALGAGFFGGLYNNLGHNLR